jgi:hypothetical protein
MLVLTLPFAFFREPPPSTLPTSTHYAIPSLPSPFQWRSPSDSLTAVIRPQSPGSVRSVLPQAFLSICFSHAASRAIFQFSFRSRSHILFCKFLHRFPYLRSLPPSLLLLPCPVFSPHKSPYPSAPLHLHHSIVPPQQRALNPSLGLFACIPVLASAPRHFLLFQVFVLSTISFKLLWHSSSRVICLHRRLRTSFPWRTCSRPALRQTLMRRAVFAAALKVNERQVFTCPRNTKAP